MTKLDAYFGNQANFELDRWNRLVEIANTYGGGTFSQVALGHERVVVYNESIATNPNVRIESRSSLSRLRRFDTCELIVYPSSTQV